MGIFGKKENDENSKAILPEDREDLKKANKIIEEFKGKVKEYPLVAKSKLYHECLCNLGYLICDIKYTDISDSNSKNLLSEIEKISSNFLKNCLTYDMKMKENSNEMRSFANKNKKFFVLEHLFGLENSTNLYCFSYNIRFDTAKSTLRFLGLNNISQNAEYMEISPADYKIREMNEFDFGEYADIRFASFKTINEESFLCDKYKKLHDMFLQDKNNKK